MTKVREVLHANLYQSLWVGKILIGPFRRTPFFGGCLSPYFRWDTNLVTAASSLLQTLKLVLKLPFLVLHDAGKAVQVEKMDASVALAALKSFAQSLPEPVITSSLFTDIVAPTRMLYHFLDTAAGVFGFVRLTRAFRVRLQGWRMH
jgi:hypothetical protein